MHPMHPMHSLKIVICGILMSAALAACGGNPLYSESFDDTAVLPPALRADNLIVGIQNSVAFLSVAEAGRGQAGYLFIEPETLPDSDYTLEATLRIVWGQASLWVRGDGAGCGGYGLIVDPTLDNYRLSAGTPTCSIQALETQTRLEVELNRDYALRIEAAGETVRGFVDGVEYFSVTDTTFAAGVPFLRLVTDGLGVARVELDAITLLAVP